MVTQDYQFSVLLPAASVDVFAVSPELLGAAQDLVGDWRFARVGLSANGGDIRNAIAKYQQYASPDLVIIETTDISAHFVEQLNTLAEMCTQGTDAVVIGPENDVQLYRSLIAMGVRDYLVTPIAREDLAAVMANLLIEKKGIRDSRLVAVMGAKGGVGASTIAQALSWDISERLKNKTLLIDAGGGWGTVAVGFGVEPTATLGEAVRHAASSSDDDMRRMFHSANEHLTLLVTGGDPMLSPGFDAPAFESMIDRFMKTYPVVVVDVSGAPDTIKKRMMLRAHEIVLVTDAHLTSLRNTRAMLVELKSVRNTLGGVELVVNKIGASGVYEVNEKDIRAALDYEPAAIIRHEPKVFGTAEMAGKPVMADKAGRVALAGIEKISRLAASSDGMGDGTATKPRAPAGESEKPASLIGGLLDKISKK